MVDSVSTVSTINASSNPAQSESAAAQLAEDFDAFLVLLTTQLQHQDPTQPMETNEFTNQIVAFTGVEQSIKTNENLEQLISLQSSNALATAVGYVGQFVDAEGRAGMVADGFGNFAYELDTPASSVDVIITDSTGKAVFQGSGPTTSGKHYVTWDGVNSFTGDQEPDGTYNIYVTATNANGTEKEDFRTYTTGAVTGAEVIDGEVVLNVAGTNVPLSSVSSIRQAVSYTDDGEDAPVVDNGTDVASGSDEDGGDNAADETDEDSAS